MARIELDKVSLTFRVRQRRRVTLKEFLVRQMFRRSINPLITVRALREVSLRIGEGERLGVIGPNGAGKSTLLKVLAGIYPPTRGKRLVEGQISSLFDLTLGFEPDSTGWDNIHYRSYLQGETPRSVRSKLQAIAAFSELGDFLDMPVRYYSAGMLVRLAFSIATTMEPQILLVDEVFGAGDMAFQQKAQERMRSMISRAKLIVFVSHDLGSVARLCDQAVWLDQGQIRLLGPTKQVVAAYTTAVTGGQSRAA
jgi:ABC-type polysaccharide/polyol phosphate transport system ATPase subunit